MRHAGINQSGTLEIAAERVGRETSFGKIVDAVEHAERSRAPVQKTADRYAGYLVYFALACAALTFALTGDARSTISVIIVAGACGIAAGTPLAVLGAIGRAARAGAIIKGGRYLEALWHLDTIAFDKTGTVTLGTPVVREIRPATGVTERAVLEAASIAVGVGLAAVGLLNPLLAAFIHVVSELTFILNSARLLPAVSRSPARIEAGAESTIAPAA